MNLRMRLCLAAAAAGVFASQSGASPASSAFPKSAELPPAEDPGAGDLLGWREYRTVRAKGVKRLFTLAASLALSSEAKEANFDGIGYAEWRSRRFKELYDISMVKISFTAARPGGDLERQSGLLLLPKLGPGESRPLSWVVFLKGTEFRRNQTPSRRRGVELPFAESLAALGYAVWAPDYAGMGDAKGVQDYCVPESLANSGVQGLAAARRWLSLRRNYGLDLGYGETGRLAVLGYSEGGTAAMAFVDALARGRLSTPDLRLLAAYPMGALLDLRSLEPEYGDEPEDLDHPQYMIYMAMGWARAYPEEIRIREILSDRAMEELLPLFDERRSADWVKFRIARILGRRRGGVLSTDIFEPGYIRAVREAPESVPYCRMRDERRLDRCLPPPDLALVLAAAPRDEVVPFSNSSGALAWIREKAPDSDVVLVELAGRDHLLGGIEALLYAIVDLDKRESEYL